MKILVVNAGSSSLKYQLLDMKDESVIAKGNCDRIGIDGHVSAKTGDGRHIEEDCSFPTHTEAFEKLVEVLTSGETKVIDSMSEISAVGHRIVQGAEIFKETCLVTDEVIDQIDSLAELAPVHNHPHALALRACKAVIPAGTPQVVVFDTAFHSTMPRKAYLYGLPYECYTDLHVRKYGFHGTSHRFVSGELARVMGKPIEELKIVSCHLGNGSSITAINGGKSVDTSMGFTPLDGLVMGTRCGSVDPSAVDYVEKKMGFTPDQMTEYMNKKSGFLGLSGIGSDNRDIQAAASEGNERALIVSEIFAYQIKKFIGSYAAAMNGLDAVIFTGGIGENAPEVRAAACSNLDILGIHIDAEKNLCRGILKEISTDDSKTKVYVIPTNEELLIARDTLALISK
ncbi:acetate/propionate family kinase [Ruminococcus sp.]|uniref:acetate/propionate family kinase n=1 Tax=Ruminococcus sp. TaxID=41978 RepID=UPI002E794AD1|nr:acetate kinase [Ruminococcus sp.]MEE0045988.1 acetate kinase [Ruminococcus sp.]